MHNTICLRSYSLEALEDIEEFSNHANATRPKLFPQTTTFGSKYLAYIWQSMEREGLDRVVFYDGFIRSFELFAQFLAPTRAWTYCFERDGEPLALWWCNGHTGHMAQIHFCIFEAGRPHAHDMGMRAVRFIMNVPENKDDQSLNHRTSLHSQSHQDVQRCSLQDAPVSALCGLTPAPFRHAVRYALGLGFQKVAQLPRATYLAPDALGGRHQGRYVDTVLTVLKREDLL